MLTRSGLTWVGNPIEICDSISFSMLNWYRSLQHSRLSRRLPANQNWAEGVKNSYGCYPTEFAGSIQNPKKIILTSNQPIRTKMFPKKVCLVPQKC
jgi:hypothetical protein